jgi:hypothetical protein
MDDISKKLAHELEATTSGLQQQIADLKLNLTQLQQMVNSPDQWRPSQFEIWTRGAAARWVTEIASHLARQQTLQQVIHQIEAAASAPDPRE